MNAEAEKNSGDEQQPEAKKSSVKSLLIWIVAAAIGIGAGFATPLLLMSDSGTPDTPTPEPAQEKTMSIPDPNEEVGYVPFDKDIVVNLNSPRFSQYLKMNFTLQVAESQIEDVTKLLEEKHDVLRNWLISHIADKRVEDIKGAQGTNRLRREIHDSFNRLLFKDGIERIQDVLFQDLSVQ